MTDAVKGGCVSSIGGAPATGPILAIDIGGTKMEAAIFDGSVTIIEGSRHRLPTGPEVTKRTLADSLEQVVNSALDALASGEVLGIGIGSAGPVNHDLLQVSPVNMPYAEGFEVGQVLRNLLPGVPLKLALDGVCIASAEHLVGAAQGVKNAVAMVISTGVGGGFILEGTPIHGHSGNAGHIGQLPLSLPSESDQPVTTLESRASGPMTVAWAQRQGWRGKTGEDLHRSYSRGDPIAIDAVRRSADGVGRAIAAVSTLLDLELAVLGGGFSNVASNYVELVSESVVEHAQLPHGAQVRVVRSGLGHDGPLIGAASLLWQP